MKITSQLGLISSFILSCTLTATAQSETDTSKTKPAVKPVVKKNIHDYIHRNFASMPLEVDFRGTAHIAKATINGKPAKFLIDSGAGSSSIEYASLKRLGLTAKASGEAKGIGGTSKSYTTVLKDFFVGPHIKIKDHKIRVNAAKQLEGDDVDGLIGADILRASNGVINFTQHRLYYPYPNRKADLKKAAEKFGLVRIPLTLTKSKHYLIKCKIGDTPANLILDTGAQQSVLDSKFVKKLGLREHPISQVIVGVGDDAKKTKVTSIPNLTMGSFGISKLPALVMDLDHVNAHREFDGILGSELLFSSGAIYDCNNLAIYLPAKSINTKDISMIPGEFPMSYASLEKKYMQTELIAKFFPQSITIKHKIEGKGSDGNLYQGMEVSGKLGEVIKTSDKKITKGAKVTFIAMIRKDDPKVMEQKAKQFFAKNPSKLAFLNPSKNKNFGLLTDIIYTDGVIRREQLKPLTQKK